MNQSTMTGIVIEPIYKMKKMMMMMMMLMMTMMININLRCICNNTKLKKIKQRRPSESKKRQ